jgi:hypothetical protein
LISSIGINSLACGANFNWRDNAANRCDRDAIEMQYKLFEVMTVSEKRPSINTRNQQVNSSSINRRFTQKNK